MTTETKPTSPAQSKPLPVVANKPVAKKSAIASKPAPVKPAEKPAITKATATSTTHQPVAKAPAVASSTSKVVAVKKADKNAVKKETKKVEKKQKVEKVKMERDSFTMPKEEYAQLATLKARMSGLGKPVKKSELLRAGIKFLTGLSDPDLQALMASVPVIKTGRPKKK